jgi:branched-chain amino acid transport system substrate-binding protein
MVLAGEAALGYICATFHATGTDFPLIQDVLKYVYTRGKGPGPESDVGTAYWIRGPAVWLFRHGGSPPGHARIR